MTLNGMIIPFVHFVQRGARWLIWELGHLNNTQFVKIEKIPLLYLQTNENLNLSCSDIEARFLWEK